MRVIRNPRMQSGQVKMSALPAFSAAAVAARDEGEESPLHRSVPDFPMPASAASQPKAAMTKAAASLAPSFNGLSSPSPAVSFEAMPMQGNFPPDTTGAVSPSYVMSASNDQVVVQDRQGHPLTNTVLDTFWDGAFPDINPAWDTNVRYDPYADRFIFVCMGNYGITGSSMLIAVSATGDPTGTWYLRRVYSDSINTTFDHPRVGFNKNWVVVTGNQVANTSGNPYLYSVVYAFDKADLYANGTKAPKEFSNITNDFTLSPALTYDPDVSTMYLMANYSGAAGSLSLSTITGAVGSEVLSLNVAFPSTLNTWASTVPQNFAPQLGSEDNIGVFDARMNTVVYRNGSLWATHTVFVPAAAPTISAVDWWQVGTDGTVQQFGRLQDPNSVYFYTYPSLAVNQNGDMLVGYSRMASSQYASAAYAFRAAADPAGTLRGEFVMEAGQGPYVKPDGNGINRWGDYSATQVDSLNDTDFWTIQEFAGPQTTYSQWGLWWANVIVASGSSPTLQSFSVSPGTVDSGQLAAGTVTLSMAAPSGGVQISLDSNSPAAQLPSGGTVLVPAGATSATFDIGTGAVSSASQVTISANYSNTDLTAQLTVDPYPIPSIPAVEGLPLSSATAGGASFVLTVYGANFVPGSVVLWNGLARDTTFASSTQLTATVLSNDIAQEGTALVTVANPAPGAGTSAAQPFVVMSSAPVASIAGASLANAADGSGNHLLTLTGADFVSGSTVRWNGTGGATNLTTTYVSPWQISAVVTAAEYGSQPASVTVINGGQASPVFKLQ